MLTQHMTRLMVGGALASALVLAIGHAVAKGYSWDTKIAFIIAMVCVAIGEFLAWHNGATAWHERRAGSVMLWGLLGVVLTGGVLYTNFSATSGNNDRKASMHLASFTTYEDVGKTERELTADVKRLEERLRMAPVRTPEAAQAAIQRAEADRFWQMTNGCRATRGAQTRKFCDDYASAVADRAMGTEALIVREELKQAQAKLAEVRDRRSNMPASVSDDQPHIQAIANMLSVDKGSARTLDGLVIPFLTQAMLLLGGILTANEAFRGKQRQPWIDRSRWQAVFGAPMADEPAPMPTPAAATQPQPAQPAPTQTRIIIADEALKNWAKTDQARAVLA